MSSMASVEGEARDEALVNMLSPAAGMSIPFLRPAAVQVLELRK